MAMEAKNCGHRTSYPSFVSVVDICWSDMSQESGYLPLLPNAELSSSFM